jgi:hypothetical protein
MTCKLESSIASLKEILGRIKADERRDAKQEQTGQAKYSVSSTDIMMQRTRLPYSVQAGLVITHLVVICDANLQAHIRFVLLVCLVAVPHTMLLNSETG